MSLTMTESRYLVPNEHLSSSMIPITPTYFNHPAYQSHLRFRNFWIWLFQRIQPAFLNNSGEADEKLSGSIYLSGKQPLRFTAAYLKLVTTAILAQQLSRVELQISLYGSFSDNPKRLSQEQSVTSELLWCLVSADTIKEDDTRLGFHSMQPEDFKQLFPTHQVQALTLSSDSQIKTLESKALTPKARSRIETLGEALCRYFDIKEDRSSTWTNKFDRAWKIWEMLLEVFVEHPELHHSFLAGCSTEQTNSALLLIEWTRGEIDTASGAILKCFYKATTEGQLRGFAKTLNDAQDAATSAPRWRNEQSVTMYRVQMTCHWQYEFGLKQVPEALLGIRRISAMLAACQRLVYLGYISPPKSIQSTKLSAAISSCPWLEEEGHIKVYRPHYLWHVKRRTTVSTKDLHGPLQYTAISHTWGRWRTDTVAKVEGVNLWAVPENTKFDVRALPEILAQAPISTEYVWLDLVCIPQRPTSPHLEQIAKQEISRQAGFFRHAHTAIAWLNDIEGWKGVRSAVHTLLMHYLEASGAKTSTMRHMQTLPDVDIASLELIYESDGSLNNWFTSLWALQEVSLRPEMLICDRNWEVLSIGEEVKVEVRLDELIAITKCCHLVDQFMDRFNGSAARRRRSASNLVTNQAVKQLHRVMADSGMSVLLNASRATILALGSKRTCKRRRGEAIMSIVGITDWFQERDTQLDFQPAYDVQFLMEAADKLGAGFYASTILGDELSRIFKASISSTAARKVGSMLPFSTSTFTRGPNEIEHILRCAHPSVSTWRLLPDFSVHVHQVALLSYTGQSRSIRRRTNGMIYRLIAPDPSKLPECHVPTNLEMSLDQWVETYAPSTRNYAICLHHNPRLIDGILLKKIGCGNLVKIGTFSVLGENLYTQLPMEVRQVDWKIL